MKEKLINNLGLKILSIFLAFLVWMVVLNVSNPEVTRTREVTLEIENGQVLTSAGRTYEISGKSTVTVAFDVRTRDDYKVRAADFRAYVNLAELYDVTGSVQVQVEVLNNRDIIANAVARPGVVRVETEELQNKRFDLDIELVGDLAEDYALNVVTLTPSYITLDGPISQVGLISSAGVEIDVNGLSSDTQGVTSPIFYDANGNRLTISNRIDVSSQEIGYDLTISKVKNVPLDFEVSGTVAPGYQYTGAETTRKSIAVVGLKSNLANINRITIPAAELSISGATADREVSLDIEKYLPEGIELAESEDSTVVIHLKVEPLVNRVIPLSEGDITREGEADGYRYRFTPGRIEVTIQGLEEDVDRLLGRDLQAVANVSGLEIGSYDVELSFENTEAFQVISYTQVRVDVTQGAAGSGTSTEGDTTESSVEETEADEGATEESTREETSAQEAAATVEATTETDS